MKYHLQRLASPLRILAVLTRLDRVCLVIVLAGLLLAAEGLAPSSASAQGSLNTAALIGAQTIQTGQVVHTTMQVPPAVINRLRQALSKYTKIPAVKLKVVEATPKTWANGCLGLAKADELCTQALIEGWRVVFSDSKRRWTYRTDKQANVYRLEP